MRVVKPAARAAQVTLTVVNISNPSFDRSGASLTTPEQDKASSTVPMDDVQRNSDVEHGRLRHR